MVVGLLGVDLYFGLTVCMLDGEQKLGVRVDRHPL